MKRSASSAARGRPPAKKRPREQEPEYHETPSVRDETGEIVWPAPATELEDARRIIRECAAAQKPTLIVPDKDADGLTSGVILQKTLELLGLQSDLISTHFLNKGDNVHSPTEAERMASTSPAYIFVLDQGSRRSPALVHSPHTALVIDHHFAKPDDFPQGSRHVNASQYPPVATTALLTYHICTPLHPRVAEDCAFLCCIGTMGDLGSSLKWQPPFPDMSATLKTQTKKAITEAISLLNAPRRTAAFTVPLAWDALRRAQSARDLQSDPALHAARAEVNAEVERCAHAAPSFSRDGRVAVLRIASPAQVHPLIATRWASHLDARALDVVMCANAAYAPGLVNFSCRVARAARARRANAGDDPVDIIALLRGYAAAHESGDLLSRVGDNFARGHVQASGGIVSEAEFADLMAAMGVGEKPPKPAGGEGKRGGIGASPQKNTIGNYFGKK